MSKNLFVFIALSITILVPAANAEGAAEKSLGEVVKLVIKHSSPIGTIIEFSGSANTPDGWLVCDGAEYEKTSFVELSNQLGTLWGAASDGKFKVPDLSNKFAANPDYISGDATKPKYRTTFLIKSKL